MLEASAGPFVDLDVTALVRAWHRGEPNTGLCLTGTERPPFVTNRRLFRSSDARDPALRPRLTIHYVGGAPAPDPEPTRRIESERELDALLGEFETRLAAEDPGEVAALFALLSRAITAAPQSWRGFDARARLLFATRERSAHAHVRALLDLRLALLRATPEALPGVRRRVLEVLEDMLDRPAPNGPDRVDEQLLVLEDLAWDELRARRDRVQPRVDQPRLWAEQR